MTFRQRIIKGFYQVVHLVLRFYWFIRRPHTRGAKCLIEYDGKFLLVRLNYAHKQWTIPGGGVNRNESFKDAAIREAKEETSIDIGEVSFIGRYENQREYKQDTVEVYFVKVTSDKFVIDPIEIKEAKWFAREELPKDRVPSVDLIMEMYKQSR